MKEAWTLEVILAINLKMFSSIIDEILPKLTNLQSFLKLQRFC